MLRRAVCAVSFLLVGCGGDAGGAASARRIAGGKEVRFQGLTFDIPAEWNSQPGEGGMLLAPPGANSSGVLEEMYLLGGDASVRSLDGDEAEQAILKNVEQLLPGATKVRGPETAKFGALEGRKWTWTAKSQFDKDVEVRVFAFLGNQGCALFALGLPEVLARRSADLEAILGSLAKSDANAGGAKAGAGGVAEELVGRWMWMSSFAANSGGSQTNTWITLQADGRYQWHYDSVSSNPNGAAWGSQDETGAWSIAGDQITFRPDRGGPYTQTLVKRNHPKNASDPMIVLDGKAYVTATNRRPW